MRRAVKVLTTITDEAELAACRDLIVALAAIKTGGYQMLGLMQKEDGLMDHIKQLTPKEKESLKGFFEFFQEVPAYHDFWEATVWAPARAEGREEGQHGMLVDHLLKTLAAKSIRLTKAQAAKLRRMPFEDLPDLDVAIQATSAADFAKRAKLNGRLNGAGRR